MVPCCIWCWHILMHWMHESPREGGSCPIIVTLVAVFMDLCKRHLRYNHHTLEMTTISTCVMWNIYCNVDADAERCWRIFIFCLSLIIFVDIGYWAMLYMIKLLVNACVNSSSLLKYNLGYISYHFDVTHNHHHLFILSFSRTRVNLIIEINIENWNKF